MIDPFTLLPTAVILLPVGWLWQRQVKMATRIDDTYTKGETKEMIDLKNKPIQDTLERNTRVSHELTQAIHKLEIVIAKLEEKE
jgi:hypothetical protein